MNMKKSIAGVMAGAMAVSAMAASVSAVADQETITLAYDLKEYKYASKPASVTIMQYYATADKPAYFIDTATETAIDGAATYGTINFGVTANWGMLKSKSIDLSLAATGADTTTTPASLTWSWKADDKNTAIYDANGVDVKVGETAGQFAVPVSTGKYTNMLDVRAFDLATLGWTGSTYKYGFNAITAKMVFEAENWFIKEAAQLPAAMAKPEGCATNNIIDVDGNKVLPSTFKITEFTEGAWAIDYIKPMKSSLKAPANVIAALNTMKENSEYYNAPIAVLNDAIANGTNVTFKFNSYIGKIDSATGKADDNGDLEQKAFGQHLYGDPSYAPNFGLGSSEPNYGFVESGSSAFDQFGSYSSAWGYNLFEGAIVVNSGITMQLNQANKFFWDESSLSFDWDTITADGKVTNAKEFLVSMLLYTPVDWYWDSLEVTVEKGEADPVVPQSPITEKDDEIEDNEIPTDTTAATTAAVVDVPSTPATGNAPVALAVIPVALAAAAVVAKKRG
jgi:hypothetical protein